MSKTQKDSSKNHSTEHGHGHHGHHDHKSLYTNLKIEQLPHSEVEISAEIPAEELEKAYKATLAEATKSVEVPGFRKGKAPEKAVLANIGEMRLLEEAADDLISHEYQHIVIDSNIEVIAYPQITVTKLARGNAISFKARVAVFPTFKLDNPKGIAKAALKKAKAAAEVTDADVEKVIKEIVSIHKKEEQSKKEKVGEVAADKKTDSAADANGSKNDSEEETEITDALAQAMGPFKNADELRTKVRENLAMERTLKAKEQRRILIGDELVGATKIDAPEVLIESEINRMWKEFEFDLSQMGLSMKDYLARIKKTEADLRSEWHSNAYKKVCLQIILNRISIDEKISPDPEAIAKQLETLKKQYPDVPEDRIVAHIETVLTNEAVFASLESAAN